MAPQELQSDNVIFKINTELILLLESYKFCLLSNSCIDLYHKNHSNITASKTSNNSKTVIYSIYYSINLKKLKKLLYLQFINYSYKVLMSVCVCVFVCPSVCLCT